MDTSSLPAFAFLHRTSEDSGSRAGREPVKQASSWSYCGPLLLATCLQELPISFLEWQKASIDGDLTSILLPFLQYADAFLLKNGLQHYWITIRATKANDEFSFPRWHTDDLFFERYLNPSSTDRLPSSTWLWPKKMPGHQAPTDWKLVTTLHGPTTLFINPESQSKARRLQRKAKIACGKEHVCDSVRCVGCSTAASHVREHMHHELLHTPIASPGLGQAVFLRVGHELGAVHSEPDESYGDRVFVNVVPGTKLELIRLMAKWGMEYPRDWAVVGGV